MEADGQRLRAGGFCKGDVRIVQPDALPDIRNHQIAESSLFMGKPQGGAEEPHIKAVLLQTLVTIRAGIAGAAGINGHAVADRKTVDTFAQGTNRSRNLVPQNDRLPDTDGAEAAILEIVQVRSANTPGPHGEKYLSGAGRGHVDLLDADIALGVEAADA